MIYHVKELQFDARVSGPDPRFARLGGRSTILDLTRAHEIGRASWLGKIFI